MLTPLGVLRVWSLNSLVHCGVAHRTCILLAGMCLSIGLVDLATYWDSCSWGWCSFTRYILIANHKANGADPM